MQKLFASAMLCLLLLLSVGSLRCESRCALQSMPAPSTQVDAMAGMDHCAMHTTGNDAQATMTCSHMVCPHESLPATADVLPVNAVWTVAAVVLPFAHAITPITGPAEPAQTPSLPQLSPLEQTSLLRV